MAIDFHDFCASVCTVKIKIMVLYTELLDIGHFLSKLKVSFLAMTLQL